MAATGGTLSINAPRALVDALDQIGRRWRCPTEIAAQRIIILALTGWKPKHGEVIQRLSHFVQDEGVDPFRRTCLMLRHHFDRAEIELGEPVRECDRMAWLGTLLEELRESLNRGKPGLLEELLADGAISADGGA